jgi:hypothetical protein
MAFGEAEALGQSGLQTSASNGGACPRATTQVRSETGRLPLRSQRRMIRARLGRMTTLGGSDA